MRASRAAAALRGCSASGFVPAGRFTTFSQSDSHPYRCVYHRFMEANVIVR